MKGLKFTEQTSRVAICLFTIYVLYGLLYIPGVEYVTSLTVGAVAYGMTRSYEFALLAVMASSFLFQLTKSRKEAFLVEGAPLVMAEPSMVQPGLRTMKNSVQGFSSFAEGFEDSNKQTGVIDTGAAIASATVPKVPTVPSVASPKVPTVPSVASPKAQTESTPAQAVTVTATPASISEQGMPAVTQPAESFEDNGGLFKLGKIPTDEKGGFHIDSGTSILNALKSLKPDQMAAMTQDTKQLIETQKSLMNMLQSFKPMMSEGKEMMATFQDMFSPTTTAPGSRGGALQAVKNIGEGNTQMH
jgi:hypothetical protein